MDSLEKFKDIIRRARHTGFAQHDIRDPDRYTDAESGKKFIREMDRAFIQAIEDSEVGWDLAAGYSESETALEDTDAVVDKLVVVNDEGRFSPVSDDPFEEVYPYFLSRILGWERLLSDHDRHEINRYWGSLNGNHGIQSN